jgi:hypothetical protein
MFLSSPVPIDGGRVGEQPRAPLLNVEFEIPAGTAADKASFERGHSN